MFVWVTMQVDGGTKVAADANLNALAHAVQQPAKVKVDVAVVWIPKQRCGWWNLLPLLRGEVTNEKGRRSRLKMVQTDG